MKMTKKNKWIMILLCSAIILGLLIVLYINLGYLYYYAWKDAQECYNNPIPEMREEDTFRIVYEFGFLSECFVLRWIDTPQGKGWLVDAHSSYWVGYS